MTIFVSNPKDERESTVYILYLADLLLQPRLSATLQFDFMDLVWKEKPPTE